jgi:hypothetical protein
VGSSALNSGGSANSALGYQALYSNTGTRSSAFGWLALYSTTTGNYNSGYGGNSLYYNSTGGSNIALGYNAGSSVDGGGNNTTSDYSIYLGNDTKALADNDQNEIVVGYNATGLGSNTVVLGNDSINTTVLKGKIGIGDTSPDQKLEVMDSGAANTQITVSNTNAGDYDAQIGFELADGTNVFTMGIDDSDGDKFKISTTALGTGDSIVIDSTGKVGINTNSPSQTLTVNGGFVYNMTQNDVTASRALGTVYQNTTGRIMYVNVIYGHSSAGSVYGYTGAANPPTTLVAQCSNNAVYASTMHFIVLPNYYYKVTQDVVSNFTWIEWY